MCSELLFAVRSEVLIAVCNEFILCTEHNACHDVERRL